MGTPVTIKDPEAIKKSMISGHFNPSYQNCLRELDNFQWPQQEEPDTETWKIWQKTLLSTICDEGGMLHQPLGIWLPSNHSWQYQYSYADQAMYRFGATEWHKHEYVKHTRQVYKVKKESKVSLLPPDAVPITYVIKHPTKYVFTTPTRAQSNAKDQPNDPETFEKST
eukprot:scaffold283137_cov66-Attheya_sp.AAC.3